jgi:hypothetical protein
MATNGRISLGLLLATLAGAGCSKDAVTPAPSGVVAEDAAAGLPDAGGRGEDPGNDASPGDHTGVPATPPDGGPGQDVPSGCDLSGRWLVTQRVVATALGQEQAAHNWFYYEVGQSGDALVVTKGLHCGFEVVAKTGLAASVDSMAAWPAFLTHNTSTGRTGQVTATGATCQVSFAREYVVRGATVARYVNPAVPLPSAAEKAEGASAGWEDWDGDGNPGVSYKVNAGIVRGTLYVCQRDWTEYGGSIGAGASKWMLGVKYGAEQQALGRQAGSSQLLETPSAPSSDPTQHRVWFHRLNAGQVVGDDAALCAQVRTLARTLLPEAHD